MNAINYCYYCGSEAHYQLKNGKWCCEKAATKCPTNKKLVSDGVKRNHELRKQGIIKENKTKILWDGIHCEYGCGNEAKYILKNGKHCCSDHFSKCPENRRKNSRGVSNNIRKRIEEGTFVCNLIKNSEGKQIWNKGLTAETSPSIQKQMKSFKKSLEEGKVPLVWKGKKMPKSAREHMSESARKRTSPRVSKKRIEYKCLNGSIVIMDSSAEVKVAKILDEHHINWIRPTFLPWLDDFNKEHHYFPDFYLTDFDLYLDPKNDYCFKVQSYKIKKLNQQYSNIEFIREYDITFEYIEFLIKRKNV